MRFNLIPRLFTVLFITISPSSHESPNNSHTNSPPVSSQASMPPKYEDVINIDIAQCSDTTNTPPPTYSEQVQFEENLLSLSTTANAPPSGRIG